MEISMIRYLILLGALVALATFFASYPLAETRSQVANANGVDCSKLANVNLANPKYARCAASANSGRNAAIVEANTSANAANDSGVGLFTPELSTCKDQPNSAEAAHLYFLNAQDILELASESLTEYGDRQSWKSLRREAVRCLTKAISLDSSNRTYLLKRVEANDDDPLLDVRDITKVIGSYPDESGLYTQRADAYVKAGQLKAALADYSKAISLEPKNTSLYIKRSTFFDLHMNDDENALADLNSLLEIDPSSTFARSRRAEIYVRRKDYANALKDLDALIEKQPTYYLYYLSRSEVYELSDDLAKSLADVNASIKHSPTFYLSYLQRAKIYRKIGKAALALRDERTAKRLETRLKNSLKMGQ